MNIRPEALRPCAVTDRARAAGADYLGAGAAFAAGAHLQGDGPGRDGGGSGAVRAAVRGKTGQRPFFTRRVGGTTSRRAIKLQCEKEKRT